MNHELHIEGKEKIEVTEVTSVDGFDEEAICINLKEEGLMIYGRNLHIESLDLDIGRLIATGEVESIAYTKKKIKKNIWERFRK